MNKFLHGAFILLFLGWLALWLFVQAFSCFDQCPEPTLRLFLVSFLTRSVLTFPVFIYFQRLLSKKLTKDGSIIVAVVLFFSYQALASYYLYIVITQ